ncbi:hypothetical protein ACWFRB_01760 [Rhodococcus sp. NPDC055112]
MISLGNEAYTSGIKHVSVRSNEAPVALTSALLAITGGELPEQSYVEYKFDDNRTQWAALWMTKGTLVYASTTFDKRHWTFGGQDSSEYEAPVTAWIRPISAIDSIAIEKQSAWHDRTSNEISATIVWNVSFAVGGSQDTIRLPFFEDPADEQSDDAASIVAELRKRWLEGANAL